VALPTGLGELRNGLIARMCRGMIAIGGGYGTLSEIAFMLRLGRPVAAVQTWDFTAPDGAPLSHHERRCATPEDAVAWILQEVSGHGG
jgi:predicted Rossmann-fold nucleotide-binding protein